MYRWSEHTSELELLIEAETPAAVLAEAAGALAEVLPRSPEGERETRRISVEAPDPPALLAAWMEELVYLADTDGFVADRVETLEVGAGAAEAVVSGTRSAPQSLIKGVTYHRLQLARTDGGWRGRAVLDV